MSGVDANRLAKAMENVTDQDADISALWMPERGWRDLPAWRGQPSQREFARLVAEEYDRLADIMVGPDGWMSGYMIVSNDVADE